MNAGHPCHRNWADEFTMDPSVNRMLHKAGGACTEELD